MNEKESASPTQACVLVIEDDRAEFEIVSEYLRDRAPMFELKWVPTLSAGLDYLSHHPVDVVLLDLFLPDSQGLDTFVRVKARAMDAPIVILSGLDDEQSAFEAIKKGAQDYLVKGQADGKRLSRVLHYAMKRHELQNDPKNFPLIDTLTGLSNREGFLTMAEHQLKLAHRTHRNLFVCFAIINDHDQIGKNFGDEEARHAVTTAAEILKESFRPSDIVARVQPDGFAIIASEQSDASVGVISARIRSNQKYCDAQFNRYPLSLSMCASVVNPATLSSQELMSKADKIFKDYRKNRKADESFVGV